MLMPDCVRSLVGYMVWMSNTMWFFSTAYGRGIGAKARLGDDSNTRA